MKIAFIGGGNMGEAMLAAVLDKKLGRPAGVSVSDVKEERRQQLKQRYGVAVTEKNREAVEGKDVVVLAIKPQNLAEVMDGLKGHVKQNQLVLSIIAGAKIETISRGLNHKCIVRVMPNTPAQVGLGMSAWTATAEVTDQQKGLAQSILRAMGKEVYFDDEKYLDMATAVSGSGPAYFFLLAESLVEAAVNIGLARQDAEIMVSQTMLGSAQLLQKSGKSAAELRRNVTSPGGTTAAALKIFEEGKFSELVQEAITAAHNRSKELGSKS
jgi:pyrroline-5-carboxylate reductase